MAPPRLALRHTHEGTSEPQSVLVISVLLAMLSIATLSGFLTQGYLGVKSWSRLPLVQWLVFLIYIDSSLFVLATAILQFGFGVSSSASACETAILLCLICYVTTKILIYLFLVEKAYIIRASNKKPRLRSKLYLFNSFGMIGVYCIIVVPNFILRIARVDSGECIIGMQRPAMIPLIVFDLLVNVYLTFIFLRPLSSLYSYKNAKHAPGSRRLRTIAMRTFVGCICTLISSIVNLSVLVGLNGEPGWVCLMCCNSDILFSAIVIQWVTSKDNAPLPDESYPASNSRSCTADEINPNRASQRAAAAANRSLASRIISTTIVNSPNRSSSSIKSHHLTLTTTEDPIIIDNAANPTKRSNISPSHTSNKTCHEGKRGRSILSTEEAEAEHEKGVGEEGYELPRLPPPLSPLSSGMGGRHHPSLSEVRVDVDYGASLSEQGEEVGDVRMGNSVVIGSPTAASRDGRKRGRSSPWR